MSWSKMAEPILSVMDPALLSSLAVEIAMRVKTISSQHMTAFTTGEDALEVIRNGWDITPFPDHLEAVTARTSLGWAYLPSRVEPGNWWAHADEEARRYALNATTNRMFVFTSLGEYADAIFAARAERLTSGALACVRPFVSAEEFETMTFLHSLGGTVTVPPRLRETR